MGMMKIPKIILALKALRELGFTQVSLYALYQLGMHSGHYRRATSQQQLEAQARSGLQPGSHIQVGLLPLPERAALLTCLGAEGKAQLLAEAQEILDGRVRLFGGQTMLSLENAISTSSQPLVHWSEWEQTQQGDVKFTWEPGRFGWAYPLCRAYWISGENHSPDERYSASFWRYTEAFLKANPPGLGAHWASAQEVALRLLAIVFAAQVFVASPHTTPKRAAWLAEAVALHAVRIPPTLLYARAQNNNHLLSEAVGLYTAALALPDHPQARRWRRLGWHWFEQGLRTQIAIDGAYSQHSANYHRLMLQLALWMWRLSQAQGEHFSPLVQERLAVATTWLYGLLDPYNGGMPNLGPNDGAYILPLTTRPFADYRPVLQAARQVFGDALPPSPDGWDEMSLWLGTAKAAPSNARNFSFNAPGVLRAEDGQSWAYLRAARLQGRPGHADQLHVDLWRRGLNIAQDAGTYLYNAAPPWNNALTHTAVHNTLTINNQEQMHRAGRFLYLERAQARLLPQEPPIGRALVAQHDGYRRLGVIHQRRLLLAQDGDWEIDDIVLPAANTSQAPVQVCLHWLLLDGQWRLEQQGPTTILYLQTGLETVRLTIQVGAGFTSPPEVFLVRAGELLHGSGTVEPTWGWSSPTYGDKIPALSLHVNTTQKMGHQPYNLTSKFHFME